MSTSHDSGHGDDHGSSHDAHGSAHDSHGDSHGSSSGHSEAPKFSPTAAAIIPDEPLHLSKLAHAVVEEFEKKHPHVHERPISVNPVISKVASWYEKLRNAMEYREDEVILRATIERILRRRLLLGGNAKTTAEPLVRELVWARYLVDETVGETTIKKVEEVIDLYLRLRLSILQMHKISDHTLNEWTYDLMSSHIEQIVKPNKANDLIAVFMFQLLKESVEISDDTEETRNAQVYLAIRKAFARDDRAFLRFHMFQQIFGRLTEESLPQIAENFTKGFEEINKQLSYPRKDLIYSFIKKQTAPYLILEDMFHSHTHGLGEFLSSAEFKANVYRACESRYKMISTKVTTAIIRSFVFILLTKLVFAFAIEGTYEKLIYGEVQWKSIGINTGIPPLLMIVVGFMIKTPDKNNTDRIYAYLRRVLSEESPRFGVLRTKKTDAKGGKMDTVFTLTWMLAFLLSFGGILYLLYILGFNFVSMGIFVFFLAIVSFLAYRISVTASLYRLGETQGLLTPIIDFFMLPIIRLGRQLTEGISQINILIFIFDFVIETPFKELFAFFEQLFYFLHTKRDELG